MISGTPLTILDSLEAQAGALLSAGLGCIVIQESLWIGLLVWQVWNDDGGVGQ